MLLLLGLDLKGLHEPGGKGKRTVGRAVGLASKMWVQIGPCTASCYDPSGQGKMGGWPEGIDLHWDAGLKKS